MSEKVKPLDEIVTVKIDRENTREPYVSPYDEALRRLAPYVCTGYPGAEPGSPEWGKWCAGWQDRAKRRLTYLGECHGVDIGYPHLGEFIQGYEERLGRWLVWMAWAPFTSVSMKREEEPQPAESELRDRIIAARADLHPQPTQAFFDGLVDGLEHLQGVRCDRKAHILEVLIERPRWWQWIRRRRIARELELVDLWAPAGIPVVPTDAETDKWLSIGRFKWAKR